MDRHMLQNFAQVFLKFISNTGTGICIRERHLICMEIILVDMG